MIERESKQLKKEKILIGNSFPLSLIRRPVRMFPCSQEELKNALVSGEIVSYWGHRNTLAAANALLGYDLTPRSDRPVVRLTADFLPELEGIKFKECWIVSPNYSSDFRPAIGEEIPPEKIASWQCLKIIFED